MRRQRIIAMLRDISNGGIRLAGDWSWVSRTAEPIHRGDWRSWNTSRMARRKPRNCASVRIGSTDYS